MTMFANRRPWLLGSALAGLTLFAAGTWLVATEAGTRVLLSGVTAALPMLSVGKVSGTLPALELEGFAVTTEGFRLKADHARIDWSPSALLTGRVLVTAGRIEGLDIAVISTDEDGDEADEAQSRLTLPVAIDVRRVDLTRLSLAVAGSEFTLARLSGGYRWEKDSMRVTAPRLTDLALRLPKNEADPTDTARKETDTASEIRAVLKTLEKDALLTLPKLENDSFLTFNLALDDLMLDRFRLFEAEAPDTPLVTLKDVAATGALAESKLTLTHFSADTSLAELPAFAISGRLETRGTWPAELTAELHTRIDALPLGKAEFTVSGAAAETLAIRLTTDGRLRTHTAFDWSPALPGIPGKLDFSLREPYTLLKGGTPAETLELGTGTLRLEGNSSDWTLSGFGTLKKGTFPATLLTLAGRGRPTGAAIADLRLRSQSGTAHFSGDVDWVDRLSWHGKLGVEKLDITDFVDVPATHLTGLASLSGWLNAADDWQAEVTDLSLTGLYREAPMSLDGSLLLKDRYRLYTPKARIALGDNRAEFLAKFDRPVFEADLKIDAPDLKTVDPFLDGALKGSVLLRGDPEHPVFVADLKGNNLSLGETHIASSALTGTLKPDRRGSVAGKVTLILKTLTDDRAPDMVSEVAAAVLEGSEKAHTLKLGIKGHPFAAGLTLKGQFDRRTFDWRGMLTAGKLTTPAGLWTQEKSARLTWKNDAKTATLATHAWSHPEARLRLAEPLVAGPSGRVAVTLEKLGMALFDNILPQGTRLTGQAQGEARARWFADPAKSPDVRVTLESRDLTLHRDLERADGGDRATISLPLRTLSLRAALARDEASLDWDARLKPLKPDALPGHLAGSLRVKEPTGAKALSGETTVESLDMSFLESFFMTGERAEGTASGALRFGGSLTAPALTGHLGVSALRIADGMTPFDMKPSDIRLDFSGMRSTLKALIKTNKGELALTGAADWEDVKNPRVRLAAKGDDLFFSLPPYARVRVSPDVTLEAQKDLIRLDGVVDIPFAKIQVNEVPASTVAVSRDEVMLTDDLLPVSPKSARIPIESRLRIRLGERVRVEAFGLKTKVAGEVDVMQTKRGLGLNGRLDLRNGRFRAYGQDLSVQKGNIIFAGPVDRPMLDIEAVRNPEKTEDDVTAGILVTGTADAPKVEVFSRPALPRQEALSYLLRGRKLDDSGDNDSNAMLTSALIGLGVSQTGGIVGTIGNAFGIRDLGLDTAGSGDNQQVVVSGYVLPRLKVKYGVGLFDSLSTLTLRYRLMPKLFLESVSGVNQSVDLLYKFEF